MSTITKKVDRGIEPNMRYQYWKSSEDADDGTAIAVGDLFMIEDSLGCPADYLYIQTDDSSNLKIRINGRVVTFPLRDTTLNWPVPLPDLTAPTVRQDTTMAAIDIGTDDWEMDGVLPVRDIEIVSWSTGTFAIFVA